MNREIKFRAWDSDKNIMILPDYSDWEDFFIEPDGGIYQSYEMGTYESYRSKRSKNLILMQFTGLKDKNGKEIYEGDIVKDDEAHYKIYWSDGCCAFDAERLEDGAGMIGFGNYSRDLIADIIQSSKYIGNIHQNPELLK